MKVSGIDLINTIDVCENSNEYSSLYDSPATTTEDFQGLQVYRRSLKYITYINLILKRIIDIVGAMIGIILLLPITIIVDLVNSLGKDDGPLFYMQERIGKNGYHFKMYKFRTMCTDSDTKLRELLENDEEARKEWEENRKLKNDPRITKIGAFLRKTSIDEVPQFINVLKGEMSLVGPRAVVDDEIDKFGIYKDKILSVKPGITGNWAAHGRSNTSYEERVKMESYYVDNFSIFLDIKIIIDTVFSVMKKEGAI